LLLYFNIILFFFFYYYVHHLDLHSFPTRRSSDLGSAAMIEKLIKAGADPNAALTTTGDTALMMAARTGKTRAVSVLLESGANVRSEEHTSELQSLRHLVCRLLLEKKKKKNK